MRFAIVADIMKLRCPYCKTVFEKLDKPVCPGCGRTLRMAWESDIKTAQQRADFRVSRGHSKNAEPRTRAALPPKPSAMMVPLLFLNYRSRFFMWMIVLCTVIVGRLLFVHVDEVKVMLSDTGIRETRSRKELVAMRTALEWFKVHCKRYPTDAEGLRALVRNPTPHVPGWRGYYIDQLTSDPWGHPYRYACTNGIVRLWGLGADGIDGTADDIASPEPDWRALMDRVNPRDFPQWKTNAAPAAATSHP